MPSVHFNYGNWQFWSVYNPPLQLGNQKVTFDGINKIILVNEGITELDFRVDVYSGWKEWVTDPNQTNSRYLEALSVIGGDPLPGDRVLGTTFFLENGWRMRTWEGDHELTVTGNVFTRTGVSAFVPTLESWTITINLNTSTLVETIETGTLLGLDTQTQMDEVWKIHGLDSDNPMTVTETSRTAGTITQDINDDGGGNVTVTRE